MVLQFIFQCKNIEFLKQSSAILVLKGPQIPVPMQEHKFLRLSGRSAQILIPFPLCIVFLQTNPSPSAWNPIFQPKDRQTLVPVLSLQDPPIMEQNNGIRYMIRSQLFFVLFILIIKFVWKYLSRYSLKIEISSLSHVSFCKPVIAEKIWVFK
jgi:hypothetical protein